MIIDPWGSVVCTAPERPGMVSATIDLGYLREVRASMPMLGHCRPELYQASYLDLTNEVKHIIETIFAWTRVSVLR